LAVGFDREGSRRQVGLEPGKGCTRDAKPRGQTVKKDGVIDGIKCSRYIKKAEARDLLMADGRD
jgi:hypothetical protein